MAPVEVRDRAGQRTGTVELDDAIFGITPNVAVMHQVVTAQLAARRRGTHSTRTRGEVSGGGRKPWRQKGTGRARQGSTRAPHWTGGGIALGPKPRDYRQRTPKKMIALALRSALSDRHSAGRVVVVESWDFDPRRGSRPRRAGTHGPRAGRGRRGRRGGRAGAAQPAERQARARPGAQRLRRALQRLGRVHTGHAAVGDEGDAAVSRDPRSVIIRPVVSEKSYGLLDRGVYTFVVHPDANKIEIRQAVESIFGVRVAKVNTLNRKGKRKRNRRMLTYGHRPDTKRAVVTLAPGERIDLFES
ncbi:MAG: hypothetical protein C4344_05285 [Acidimicrobiia bacterium]